MAPTTEYLESEPLDSPGAPGTADLLGMAWRRKSLLLLGLVVGLVAGTLYYAQSPPVYKSDAQILVVKKQPDSMPLTGSDARLSYYEDYLATHQAVIKSPIIIAKAVQKPELQRLTTFAGVSDPAGLVQRAMVVSRDTKEAGGNNILTLGFRGKVPDECPTILNAVMESYKDFLDDTYKKVNNNSYKLITEARDILEKNLAKLEKDYREFKENSPLLVKSKDGANIHQERLANIESKRAALAVRRTEIQGRLASIDKALKEGKSRNLLSATLPEAVTRTAPESIRRSGASLEEQLLPLLQQEQSLMEDYGPGHPLLQSVRNRIKLTKEYFKKSRELKTADGDDDVASLDTLELVILSLKQELNDIQMGEDLLSQMAKEEYEPARRLINIELQDEAFRRNIANTQQLYETTLKRLTEVGLLKDYGGFDARTIAPATAAVRVEPKAFPIFAVAVFLGLLGGFGLAYVADRADKSFRTPEEIRRHLGLPVVGHIPRIDKDDNSELAPAANGAVFDPVLVTHHDSQSREAESFRGVRTALYFSMHGKDFKVIQVTSPNMGDGKTTVAANLAVSIAQSGKRTVLIDADFRRPRVHKVFGLSPQVGLASVIEGEAELNAVIQESGIPGLSIIPCGPSPSNPAELLTSPRFQELLGLIGAQYDFVLVDTPPLLAVTDPCVVAPRVDGVLLAIRVNKNGRPNAIRAKEILNTLGVPVLGVVVNGVDSRQGEYGYGHYQYGYGYTNGYYKGESYYTNGEPQAETLTGEDGQPVAQRKRPASHRGRNGRNGKAPQGFFNRLLNRQ